MSMAHTLAELIYLFKMEMKQFQNNKKTFETIWKIFDRDFDDIFDKKNFFYSILAKFAAMNSL
jgi:hypothetical protein